MLWLITLGSPQSSSYRFSLIFQLFLILAYSTHLSRCLDPSASVTIDQLPAYSLQQKCGKGCIQNNFDGGPDVEEVLGCTLNGCYCGTQNQPDATSFITSCWSAYCGATEPSFLPYDISTALSIYDSYCGIEVAAASSPTTVPATTTGANSLTSTTGVKSSTSAAPLGAATSISTSPNSTGTTSSASSTAQSSTDSTSPQVSNTSQSPTTSHKIGAGAIAGIAVGSIVVCAIVVVLVVGIIRCSQRRIPKPPPLIRLSDQDFGQTHPPNVLSGNSDSVSGIAAYDRNAAHRNSTLSGWRAGHRV